MIIIISLLLIIDIMDADEKIVISDVKEKKDTI
jgi:hypothetical protein